MQLKFGITHVSLNKNASRSEAFLLSEFPLYYNPIDNPRHGYPPLVTYIRNRRQLPGSGPHCHLYIYVLTCLPGIEACRLLGATTQGRPVDSAYFQAFDSGTGLRAASSAFF
jgi:hypothetical protein